MDVFDLRTKLTEDYGSYKELILISNDRIRCLVMVYPPRSQENKD